MSSAVAEPLPGLRFKDVMIPAVKKHYRGKGIKKFYICCDGASAFNNKDKARAGGGGESLMEFHGESLG